MRRLTAVLLSVLLSHVALAGSTEKDPHGKDRSDRLGRAMVLHPTAALSESDIADLASRGIFVRRALAGGRYIARVQNETAVANDSRIVSAEPFTSRMKLQRSAVHEAARAKPYAHVNVIFHDDVDFDAARDAILDAGGALDDVFRVKFAPSQRLTASVPPAALEALASDDRVMSILGATRRKPRVDNLVSGLVSGVDLVQAAPYGLSGQGVTVSLFELAEAQASHPEFGSRFTVHAAGGTTSDKSHATHVAGTIGAAGVNPNALGMAPKVAIHEFCLPISGSNQCQGDWIELKDEELEPLGIVADNNSWGYELGWYSEGGYPVWDGSEIFYGAYIPDFGGPFIDEISIERNVLFVHSAGNDGNSGGFDTEFSEHRHTDDEGDVITTQLFCYSKDNSGTDCPARCNGTNLETGAPAGCEKLADRHHPELPFDTIGVVASAKNIITVGAVQGIPGNISIGSISSRGPAKDGRVKPDVVARGVNVFSSVPTSIYERKTGTSMASPVVTGIAALLTEQWRKTFNGANPLPEQLKALILAGAVDLGNPGPDYTFGFGLVNAKNSADLIIADGGTGNRIQTASFPQGQVVTREFPVVLTQPQNLRVLANWADPPTILLSLDEINDPVLVNDLDLKVIDPSGATHLPYVLDRLQYQANATRGVNTVDNVEEVEIANAPAGTYRVQLTGKRVTEPQNAILVANAQLGAAAPPPCVDRIEALGANDDLAHAFGNIAPFQAFEGAICTADDADYYKFVVNEAGPVNITLTANDTALRLTAFRNGTQVGSPREIAANGSSTMQLNEGTVPTTYAVRVDRGTGATLGAQGRYSLTVEYGVSQQPRRRAVRR